MEPEELVAVLFLRQHGLVVLPFSRRRHADVRARVNSCGVDHPSVPEDDCEAQHMAFMRERGGEGKEGGPAYRPRRFRSTPTV